MNLKDLIAKMTAIEEGVTPPLAPEHTDGAGAGDSYNNDVEECGMPVAIGGPAPQDNHVTMNISMNGTGSDGVRNLMNILKDIENGETKPHMGHEHEPEAPLMGSMVRAMGQEEDVGEEYENSVHGHKGAHTYGVDKIIAKGDDMHSKGHGALKHNGGENPMHESLVNRLSQMYAAIKEERTEEKDEKGNVVRWKEEGEWTKKSGKEGRGKVTNLSDKARRETEKLSKKEERTDEGVVDVANTVGQGVGSVVGTVKDAWNAVKQGYNQTSTGSSTPANNVPAPMTPKGSLGLPPSVRPAPSTPPGRYEAPQRLGAGPAPSTPPGRYEAPQRLGAGPAPSTPPGSLEPTVDEGDDQWSGQAMPGGYQDQAEKQLDKFGWDHRNDDVITQLKNSPELLARMGLAIVGSPAGRFADNLGFGPGAAKVKQNVNPMEESADLTAMLKIARLR